MGTIKYKLGDEITFCIIPASAVKIGNESEYKAAFDKTESNSDVYQKLPQLSDETAKIFARHLISNHGFSENETLATIVATVIPIDEFPQPWPIMVSVKKDRVEMCSFFDPENYPGPKMP